MKDSINNKRKYFTVADYTPWASLDFLSHKRKKEVGILPPCTYGTPFIEYFNDTEVRTKLHIPV